jgi:glycosidase
MRVIADFVMNHTSDQHPWFQSARASRDSPYRDFYVWRDDKPEEKPGDVVFPDKENSNWAWDEQAGQYYLHRFYSFEPDLNVANPQVRDELAQVMAFWIHQGLSGFRVDAVPFLIEPTGLPDNAIHDPHKLLRDLRAYLNRRNGEAILLGEVNLPPKTCARSSATRTATSSTWRSTSSATRRSTSRSRAARPNRWRARCAPCPSSRRPRRSGASSATTTS